MPQIAHSTTRLEIKRAAGGSGVTDDPSVPVVALPRLATERAEAPAGDAIARARFTAALHVAQSFIVPAVGWLQSRQFMACRGFAPA
jgi:hypothetical protein